MTDQNLERQLRDHYLSMDAGSSGRATTRVADALDRAPDRRRTLGRGLGRFVPAAVAVGAVFAAVAVLAVVLLPFWYGSRSGAGVKPTGNPTVSPAPATGIAAAQVDRAGMSRNGVLWAVRGTVFSISTDNGRTWRPSDAGGPIAHAAVTDADHAWLLMPSSGSTDITFGLSRTSDGGTTWQHTDIPGTYSAIPPFLTFVDSNVGFAILAQGTGTATGDETVLRTEDGGVTWAVTGTTAPLRNVVVAVDANTLWIGDTDQGPGPRPLLSVSRDAGATWSDVTLPGLGDASEALYVLGGPTGVVTFVSATEGYVGVFQRTSSILETHYYRTTDGGRTWSQVASLAQQMLVAPVFLDATHWYQPGFGEFSPSLGPLGLGITADGGQTWTTVAKDGLPSGAAIAFLWTADGQNGAAIGVIDPSSGDGKVALFLTWDGGKTWQLADFSAR